MNFGNKVKIKASSSRVAKKSRCAEHELPESKVTPLPS